MNVLHEKETKEAYEKAKSQYIKIYPQSASIQLKYDPKMLLTNLKPK